MIIGLSGKVGVGKNLVANIIQYWLWKSKVESALNTSIHYTLKDFINNSSIGESLSGWKQISFADKIKDITCIIIGCTREQLEDREFKEKELGEEWSYNEWYNESTYSVIKLTPRKIMQIIGTDFGRQMIHSNIWINSTFNNYKNSDNWIITDVRFPNEAKAIKDREGFLIRINRDSFKNFKHLSEIALDNYQFDYIIDNNSTIEDLTVKVKEILLKEKLLWVNL